MPRRRRRDKSMDCLGQAGVASHP